MNEILLLSGECYYILPEIIGGEEQVITPQEDPIRDQRVLTSSGGDIPVITLEEDPVRDQRLLTSSGSKKQVITPQEDKIRDQRVN